MANSISGLFDDITGAVSEFSWDDLVNGIEAVGDSAVELYGRYTEVTHTDQSALQSTDDASNPEAVPDRVNVIQAQSGTVEVAGYDVPIWALILAVMVVFLFIAILLLK